MKIVAALESGTLKQSEELPFTVILVDFSDKQPIEYDSLIDIDMPPR